MTRSALLLLVLVASLTGCARSEAVVADEMAWSERALREHLRQLAESLAPADSARAARRTLYAARQMRAAGLMPARDPSFLMRTGAPGPTASRVGPASGHVLGYVAGRHPSYAGQLVLVAADLDGAAAAAVLETARVLAERALDTQEPERTVLFALWTPPRTGALGLQDYLAHPTWSLAHVNRVLLVTADTSASAESRRLLDAHGIAADVVSVVDRNVAGEGAGREVEQARALARAVVLTGVLYAHIRSASLHAPAE